MAHHTALLQTVPDAGVPSRLLRRAMGHFATGVAVVTARDGEGRAFGTTANSLTSVSLEPPLLLVCLTHGSETLTALRATGRFGVSVLGASQRELSDRFAKPASPTTWLGVRTADAGGVPLLHGAAATAECEVHELLPGGDHAIVVGHVVGADHVDGPHEPLLYHRGAYAALADPAPAPAPPPAVEVALPSLLGDLRMLPLAPDDAGAVSVAVSVGEPRGSEGALLYLHRGCLLGDALGSAVCAGRTALRDALDRMGREGPGVVVYHRRGDGGAACCLSGGATAAPTEDEAAAVRRAVRALSLGAPRLIGTSDDARVLAEAGVRLAGLASHDHKESPR